MGTINKQANRFELTTVWRDPEAKADIVLVHGLNGNPQRTWTAHNGVYWPTDLLPASLKNEHANVLVYGYNADVFSSYWSRKEKNPSDNYIHLHAQSLITTLTHYRKSEGTERNPIIWVAHSLGGILTKSALLYSNDVRAHHQEDLRSIFVSTYGIIFLGTPHNGSDAAAWGRIIQRMVDAVVPRKMFETESVLLKTLKKDNEALQQISNHFMDIYQRFRIHMAHENHKTDVKGSKILVVDATSAGPQLPGVTYYGIEATHSNMCKFESENAPGYRTVSTALREWVADAPNLIPIRWGIEEEERQVRANLENMERARPYQGTAVVATAHRQITAEGSNNEITFHQTSHIEASRTTVPLLTDSTHSEDAPPMLLPARHEEPPREEHQALFIHPETFRPNSFFVGREDELRGLHEMLMDRKRRSEGTSAVLIQCLPGGGKTHLARQYVFQHKDDYPGGVYWVRAKSRHELEYWFLRIARNEIPRGWVSERDAEELRDPNKIIQVVRKWLNAQSEWLMVFDGVHFDTPGLAEFIPDARNTSLIYTSTERAVTGNYRFDNPQVMELGLLTAQQAQQLLLIEMEKKQPWSAEDQAMALELVQLMGRLPLMIHVAAQHLKATREPLARYLKSYRSRPRAGDLPAYRAVLDQLEARGETAAVNLISLLAFFDQHLPVEMLSLGLSVLDKTTPIKTSDAAHKKATLNNTLKVLIAFALVGRSESGDISPTSSRSSKRSFDKQADALDLLRIHSVVQAFFIEYLHEQRLVHFWLERAVAVWCRSYDEADRRIKEDPRVGLPDDYRRFAIHGQKLSENLAKFQRKYHGLARAREWLEQRLGRVQGQIDELSRVLQRDVGGGEEHPASVFDRISTSSQSDGTLQSTSSQLSWVGSVGGGDPAELVQSPVVEILEAETLEIAPYPSTPVMPALPEIGYEDDEETVILSAAETQLYIGATESPEIIAPSQPQHVPQQPTTYQDWEEAIPHHRVIRRQETRRYRDRAGAWRDRTVSDPRVGLSWEVAVGSVSARRSSSKSPLGPRLTAQSEAEMELNKIKLTSPPSPRGPRDSFGPGTLARPKILLGRNSWALPQAQKTPDTEVAQIPPEAFSTGLAQVLSSPKAWPGATIDLLKAVLPSGKAPESQACASVRDEVLEPPGPIFRGNRSANSSPASNAAPFPPPSFSGIPTEDLMMPGLPHVVRRWDTAVNHPDGATTSSGVEWASSQDPMSMSYPSLRPHAQQKHSPPNGAQLWLRGGPAAGYSSQPMSRNASHQSNPSISINMSSSPQQISPQRSPHSRPPSPPRTPEAPVSQHSIPIPTAGSRLSPSQFLATRPASYTETEPSPNLGTPFSDIDTSYHRWEQHHGHNHGHAARAATGLLVDRIASFPHASTSAAGSGNTAGLSRWRAGRRGRKLTRGRARSGSGSGRVTTPQGIPDAGIDAKKRSQSLSPSISPHPHPNPSPNPTSTSTPPSLTASPVPLSQPFSPPPLTSTSRPRSGSGSTSLQALAQHNLQQLHHNQAQGHHPLAAAWSTPPFGADGTTGSELGTPRTPPTATMVAGGEPMARSVSAGSGPAAGIRVGNGVVVEFGSPNLGGSPTANSGDGNGRRTTRSSPGMMGGLEGLGILE